MTDLFKTYFRPLNRMYNRHSVNIFIENYILEVLFWYHVLHLNDKASAASVSGECGAVHVDAGDKSCHTSKERFAVPVVWRKMKILHLRYRIAKVLQSKRTDYET